jgi:UDP-3-O-acyl-N-acetylglucosamine deacetylase
MDLRQRTVAEEISCTGIGLHSGKTVKLTIKPAPPNSGICFERVDISPL